MSYLYFTPTGKSEQRRLEDILGDQLSAADIATCVVDGQKYPKTEAGVLKAISEAGPGGTVIVPPGTTIDVNSGIVIDYSTPGLQLLGYGATLRYVGSDVNTRIVELRSTQHVRVKGFHINAQNAQKGAAFTLRRPSDLDMGYPVKFNVIEDIQVTDCNIGIAVGINGEGQVDTNEVKNVLLTDCQTGVVQDDDQTEAMRYTHVTCVGTIPNQVHFDLVRGSVANCEGLITGGTGPNAKHIRIGGAFRNAVFLNPHVEVKASTSIAIDWQATSAVVIIHGGVFSHFAAGNPTLMDFTAGNSWQTAGTISFFNSVLYADGTSALLVQPTSAGPYIYRFEGPWTRIVTTGKTNDTSYLTGIVGGRPFGHAEYLWDNGASISSSSEALTILTPDSYGGSRVERLSFIGSEVQLRTGGSLKPESDGQSLGDATHQWQGFLNTSTKIGVGAPARWRGSLASAPTLEVTAGDLYKNTVDGKIYIYADTWIALT